MRWSEAKVRSRLDRLPVDFLFLPGQRHSVQSPICVVLHGKGDRPQAFAGIHDELELHDFDFLCLQGWLGWEDGYRWMFDEPRHQPTLCASAMILVDVLKVLNDLGYSNRQIYFLGHSQGGRVLYHFLLHAGLAFGGFIGVSTYFPDRLWDVRRPETPFLITHGSRDRVIPVKEVVRDLNELHRIEIPFEYCEFPKKSHDFDLEHEMPIIGAWLTLREEHRLKGICNVDNNKTIEQVFEKRVAKGRWIDANHFEKHTDGPISRVASASRQSDRSRGRDRNESFMRRYFERPVQ